MAKSNKPIVWGPFAAGGTITAFVTPVLIVLTLLAALGHVPDALTFAHLREYAVHWFGKVVIVAVISLSLWTSAHRLRITFYDLGVRCDQAVAIGCYTVAAIGTIACLLLVLRI
jgi:fumarate reductase subunit D